MGVPAVGSIVKVIVAATQTRIPRLQQVFMLIHHPKTEYTIHRDYEFRQCHGSR